MKPSLHYAIYYALPPSQGQTFSSQSRSQTPSVCVPLKGKASPVTGRGGP
jgi:hypothetical protein